MRDWERGVTYAVSCMHGVASEHSHLPSHPASKLTVEPLSATLDLHRIAIRDRVGLGELAGLSALLFGLWRPKGASRRSR